MVICASSLRLNGFVIEISSIPVVCVSEGIYGMSSSDVDVVLTGSDETGSFVVEELLLSGFGDDKEELLSGFCDDEEEPLSGFFDDTEELLSGFCDDAEELLSGFFDDAEELLSGFCGVTEEALLSDSEVREGSSSSLR